MKKEKRITGSIFAKIVAFFILAISTIVGFGAIVAIVLLVNSNAYNYQSQEKCVQVVAREMMVNYAWADMHSLRDGYSMEQPAAYLEEYCRDTNYSAEIYKEDELVWSNYGGEETPYSFRYVYTQLVSEPLTISEPLLIPESEEIATEMVEREFTIRMYVDPTFPCDDEYGSVYNRAVVLCEGRNVYPIAAVVCVLISLVCFIFLMCSAGQRNGREGITPGILTNIHLDVLTVIFGCVAFYGLIIMVPLVEYGFDMDALWQLGLAALLGGAEVVWCTIYCMDFAIRLKTGAWWKHTLIAFTMHLIGRIAGFLYKGMITLMKGFPLILNVVVFYLALCILEFGVLCSVLGYMMNRVVILWLLEKVLLFGVLIYITLVCKKLQAGSKALAEGNLNFKLDTSKMLFSFKDHGENLNQIGAGISKAVAERMKSEHLKTELITNVSHDLKTPLTSIINYADLLTYEVKKTAENSGMPNVQGDTEADIDKIAEYSEVLYRQSKRLKKLLEDLVEASKATTGAIEVNLTQCEIGVLLSQAVGEYEQRFAEKQLNLIVRQPEEPVLIMVDGRHLWRVFDNLLNNICKYAQDNSRVYLSVENKESQVEIIFRNMSKYALDVSAEELEERFVRGDKSRHIEGNGLGLSIAKSLVELQNGRMEIVTDGDLFKVTLYFVAI